MNEIFRRSTGLSGEKFHVSRLYTVRTIFPSFPPA